MNHEERLLWCAHHSAAFSAWSGGWDFTYWNDGKPREVACHDYTSLLAAIDVAMEATT